MFVRAADSPVKVVEPGITRQVLSHDSQLMIVKVGFEKGAVGALHAHPHRQATYVERGRFRFTIGDAVSEIEAGDSCFLPPDVRHGVVALEDGVLIDIFSPARADFLG